MEWYSKVLRNYAVFEGRARRKEFWWFWLVNILISLALGFVEGATRMFPDTKEPVLGTIYSWAIMLPTLAVWVRRMHDANRSGWWVLCPLANLAFCFDPGTRGGNRFGPDPKASA